MNIHIGAIVRPVTVGFEKGNELRIPMLEPLAWRKVDRVQCIVVKRIPVAVWIAGTVRAVPGHTPGSPAGTAKRYRSVLIDTVSACRVVGVVGKQWNLVEQLAVISRIRILDYKKGFAGWSVRVGSIQRRILIRIRISVLVTFNEHRNISAGCRTFAELNSIRRPIHGPIFIIAVVRYIIAQQTFRRELKLECHTLPVEVNAELRRVGRNIQVNRLARIGACIFGKRSQAGLTWPPGASYRDVARSPQKTFASY